jgi:hypothetical protein
LNGINTIINIIIHIQVQKRSKKGQKVSKKHKVGKVPRGNEILETFQKSVIFDTF